MKRILKRKAFAQWQMSQKLPDAILCNVVREMDQGLIDANLGGLLYKKRVARAGMGKRGSYRILLSAKIGTSYVFLYGFQKNGMDNITKDEKLALQYVGKVFLDLTPSALQTALQSGVLIKVHCNEQNN